MNFSLVRQNGVEIDRAVIKFIEPGEGTILINRFSNLFRPLQSDSLNR
jgi:hypothetical protein